MPIRLAAPVPDAAPPAAGRGLRILYLSDLLGPHDYRFLSALTARGHRVTLLTYLWDIGRLNFVNLGYDVRRIPGLEVIREASLCVPPVSGNVLTRRLRAFRHNRLMERRVEHVRRIAAELRPDIVHAGWVQTSGWYAARAGLKPLILMPWGSDILIDAKRDAGTLERTREVLRAADAVTCDCGIVQREIQALHPIPDARFLILPWGVDLKVFRGRQLRTEARRRFGWGEEPVVVSTRTFRSVYAVDATIRGFAAVLRERPDARLVLLGDGPEMAVLKGLTRSLGVAERTTWLGYSEEARIVDLLSAADLYVSPSLSDGSSVSLLEAMACALPCVVSDLPGNREWIEDGTTGRLVSPGDAEATGRRMKELLDDPWACIRMGEAAREVIRRKADWHRNLDGLDALYATALAGRGAAA